MIDEDQLPRYIGTKLDDRGTASWDQGRLNIVLDLAACLRIDIVEDLTDHMEAAREVRTTISYEDPDRLALLDLRSIVPSQSTNAAIEDHVIRTRSEEHTSELQSRGHLVCRLLLEK